MQMPAYNDAVKKFRFQTRYIAFIDGDEFIYPKLTGGVIEVIDEILSHDSNAAGLLVNWHIFGSNGQEKADYTRGVLERFTRRSSNKWAGERWGNAHVKTIANPRKVKRIGGAHYSIYFEGFHTVNEKGDVAIGGFNYPVTVDKIVLNHYFCKSWEEFDKRKSRGDNDKLNGDKYSREKFNSHNRNEEFDDGILKYHDARAKVYQPPKPRSADDLLKALEINLSTDSYAGKMETFLTCRAVAAYLQTKLADDSQAKIYEEASLKAILEALKSSPSVADKELFKRELPKILELPYPVVEDFRKL